jgi:subtilisin
MAVDGNAAPQAQAEISFDNAGGAVMPNQLNDTLAALGYAKVIVELKSSVAGSTAAAMAAETSIEGHFTIPSEEQTVSLAATATRHASKRFTRARSLDKRKVRIYPHLGLAIGYVDRGGAASLARDSRVGEVVEAPELSLIKPTASRPATPKVKASWGIERMKIPRLWAAGFRGEGVVVGHLDTGVDGRHPALKMAIAAFAEFDMAGDKVSGAKPWDSGDHGTHTAGTIVGRSTSKGAFGVAPEAKLASGMVIEGGQVIDRVLAGMEWIVEQRVRILSMSLGLRGFTPAFQVIVDALRRQNVLPVIAVGNEGPRNSRSPGNYHNVLSVGAIDAGDRVADFSCSQNFDRPDDPLVPDIVGPGVAILSSVPGGFAEMDGTSMATPHIAGLAALLLQAKPNATTNDLEQAILKACSRPPGMPANRANRGIPDAVVAFTQLTGQALPTAITPSARKSTKGPRSSKGRRGARGAMSRKGRRDSKVAKKKGRKAS